MSEAYLLYVDPNGNDSNSGTAESPLKTLYGAREAIRAIKRTNGLPNGGITVLLGEGIYRHEQSFILEEQDSGTAEAPIVYAAAAGADARIIGGISLPTKHFIPVTDESVKVRLRDEVRDLVQQIDLKALGLKKFGQISKTGFGLPATAANPELFFNGSVMSLARYPNQGYETIDQIIDPGGFPRDFDGNEEKIAEEFDKDAVFQFRDDRPLHWENTGDIWMYGYWQWDWADGNLRIKSIDSAKRTITTEGASYYSMRADQRYYYYNILEELDEPGEWYLDRKKGVLYFYPPAPLETSPETANVELSLLAEPLVLLNNVQHIAFEKLTFEVACGSGVQIIDGNDNVVSNCTLRRLGGMAVEIGEKSEEGVDSATGERQERYIRGGKRNGVVDCKIYDTGVGGIVLSGGSRITLEAGENYARFNDISNYSRLKLTYSAGIELIGAGQTAANNYIHHAPHVGILLYGNDHIVEYNEIYKVLMETGDAGAIYIGRDWTEQGNIIRYNFVHHIHNDVSLAHMGIYLDDMASGVEIYGNVLYDVEMAVLIGGGRSNVFRDNLILNCARSVQLDARSMPGEWAAKHSQQGEVMHRRLLAMPIHSEPWRNKYPALLTLWEDMPSCPKYNTVERNVIYKTGITHTVGKETISDHEDTMLIDKYARQYGIIQKNLVTNEDLSFANEQEQNFALRPDSLVFDQIPDFENIPFAQIGLTK